MHSQVRLVYARPLLTSIIACRGTALAGPAHLQRLALRDGHPHYDTWTQKHARSAAKTIFFALPLESGTEAHVAPLLNGALR
jgi:hypothetical protein